MTTQQDPRRPEAAADRDGGAQRESALRPPVDVFETTDGVTLQADMPGVARENLSVQLEGTTLTVEGRLEIGLAPQMEALYADVRSTVYRLSFVLSAELDGTRIEAGLRDGVLTLRIPRREELKPRRIEVRAA